jgi:hypothetical protein
MSETSLDEDMITPQELRRISEDKEMAEIREALEHQKRLEAQQKELYTAFINQHIQPDAKQRLAAEVRQAAERGQNEIQVMRFPSDFCSDGGRAVNNFEPDWHDSLTGYAKEAYEAWEQHLQPLGYKLRAQVLNYPNGMPGDIGIFLRW